MTAQPAFIDPELGACMAENAGRPAADITAMTPHEARATYAKSREPWNTGLPDVAKVDHGSMDTSAGVMRFVRLTPHQADEGTVVYLHGGGWVTGGIDTHDSIMRRIADLSRHTVIGLDYPRAPEARRPVMIEACRAGILAVMAENDGPVVIAGDSAGAELALSSALALRDERARLPDGLCLAYPALWPRFGTPSHARSGDGRFGLSTAKMKVFWDHYLGDHTALPDRPDVAGLPKCLIMGAALDCLLDDAMDFAALLKAQEVKHELHVPDGTVHGFLHYSAAAQVAMDAHHTIARFIRTGR